MSINLKGRSLDSLLNFTNQEVNYLIDLAIDLKASKHLGIHQTSKPLVGKNIVLLFQKDSTRTRCAFEVVTADLGGSITYIGPSGSNMGKKESIEDTAKVLGRFYDGIEFWGYDSKDLNILVKFANVPVWNGLTNDEHLTQAIADYMTMKEHLKELKNKKVVFVGDIKNNVSHSILIGAAFMGMHCVLCGPEKYFHLIRQDVITKCQKLFDLNGGSLTLSNNKLEAVQNADVIYTDVWVSLGEPFELFEIRINDLQNFQIDMQTLQAAKPSVIFLHCLPAFHDDQEVDQRFGNKYSIVKNGAIEVTNEVFQSQNNKCFDQAENRMHSIKAIILATIGYSKY